MSDSGNNEPSDKPRLVEKICNYVAYLAKRFEQRQVDIPAVTSPAISQSSEAIEDLVQRPKPAPSQEYVLERLDLWYFDRVKRNYTPETADELTKKTKEFITSEAHFKDKDYWFRIVDAIDQVESRLSTREFFTRSYSSVMESGINRMIMDHLNLTLHPEGFKQEYIDPVIQHSRKFKSFVDSVRQCLSYETPSDFGKELCDDEIDQKYIEAFGNAKGLSDFWTRYASLAIIVYDYDLRRGAIARETHDLDTSYYKIIRFQQPIFFQAIFSDLEK